jgi:UDP-3-O-acyl-N-acetylglucosamine deacetylase
MIYSISFELKGSSTAPSKQASTVIWAKSKDEPTIDTVEKLLERLYAGDIDKKTIQVLKGGEEWDDKEMQKGARLYDLDQE